MIAYFDCFSGISGDMTLGALVDAGASLARMREELCRLPVNGYELSGKRVERAGMSARKVHVRIKSEVGSLKSEGRTWKDIQKIVRGSSLSPAIKDKGLFIFRRLFEAEAEVHGKRFDRVHLHELGAIDCIVDIFGVLICLDILDVTRVHSSALNLGSGIVQAEHGILPAPSPAAVELLRGVPVYSSDIPYELTTPTGAALISSLASGFGPMPMMHIAGTGTGAGDKNFRNHPNVLRIILGTEQGTGAGKDALKGDVLVMETNIDDMNPQAYEYVMERLFDDGALDVYLTPVIMKKGRPGIVLTVLCTEDRRDALSEIVLAETTSIGLRFSRAGRTILTREIRTVDTKYGKIPLKTARLGKGRKKVSPEYEDCKRIARKLKVPLIEVMKAALGGR
ncbi:MAG: nickel pincer cofactor biosynthesis protein LarC [Nitrospiraceae bacterium]|nr:MAG: nickel pincer cofactor biosynthesis protein LarC [Nitrospiraceae bacterium]